MTAWKRFLENKLQKVMIIMRGVSGSGKSTKARQMAGPSGQIFSTDDFFGSNYDFDETKIAEAHQWNQERVRQAAEQGISPVVVDNTNVEAWEMKPYVQLAQQYGYEVQFGEPDTEIWQQAKQANGAALMKVAQELSQLNSHGVPAETIADMLSKYSPADVKQILASKAPWENDNNQQSMGWR